MLMKKTVQDHNRLQLMHAYATCGQYENNGGQNIG